MSLVRFDPFRELTTAQSRINSILADAFSGAGTEAFDFLPAVDIRTGADHSLIIEADLPGMPKEAISVNVENRTLTIRGERKRETVADDKDTGFHRAERVFGSFLRAFTLPESADASKVKADYKNGVLTLTIPVAEQAKPRAIEVKVA
jgi:HSP20 family protein